MKRLETTMVETLPSSEVRGDKRPFLIITLERHI
jgi:hypothetical protein